VPDNNYVPETLSWCRKHYVPPVSQHIACPQFGNRDGMDGGCWWCMEMTPYQWHMCGDEGWLRRLMSPFGGSMTKDQGIAFIESSKQKHPHGNERRILVSEME